MKFKLFKADGSPSGDVDIKSFPTLEEGKADLVALYFLLDEK